MGKVNVIYRGIIIKLSLNVSNNHKVVAVVADVVAHSRSKRKLKDNMKSKPFSCRGKLFNFPSWGFSVFIFGFYFPSVKGFLKRPVFLSVCVFV